MSRASFAASYGAKNSRSLGLDTSHSWRRFALSANVLCQDSDSFVYPDPEMGTTERVNAVSPRSAATRSSASGPSMSTTSTPSTGSPTRR